MNVIYMYDRFRYPTKSKKKLPKVRSFEGISQPYQKVRRHIEKWGEVGRSGNPVYASLKIEVFNIFLNTKTISASQTFWGRELYIGGAQ